MQRRELLTMAAGAAILPQRFAEQLPSPLAETPQPVVPPSFAPPIESEDGVIYSACARWFSESFNQSDVHNHVKFGNSDAVRWMGPTFLSAHVQLFQSLRANGLDAAMQNLLDNPDSLPTLNVDALITTLNQAIAFRPGFDVEWLRTALITHSNIANLSLARLLEDIVNAIGWDPFHIALVNDLWLRFIDENQPLQPRVDLRIRPRTGSGCFYTGWGLFYLGFVARGMTASGFIPVAAPEAWAAVTAGLLVGGLVYKAVC